MPVAQTASVLTARVSAVLSVCVKVAKVIFAGVDLKYAGVQLAPVPVLLLVCLGNLEDAREPIVNVAQTASVHLELALVQFLAHVCTMPG